MNIGNRKDVRPVRRASASLVAAVAITAPLVVFLGMAGASSRHPSTETGPGITQVPTHGHTRASKIPPYTVYYLGATFEGLRVTEVSHVAYPPRAETPEHQDDVTYLYGDGTFQIHSTPLCEAHAALYTQPGDTLDSSVPEPHVALRINGVPAAFFPRATILEVYTRHTTISIGGGDASQLRRAAGSLRVAPAGAIPRVGHTLWHLSDAGGLPPIVRRFKRPDPRVLRRTRAC